MPVELLIGAERGVEVLWRHTVKGRRRISRLTATDESADDDNGTWSR
jgi:hypothetical protein